MTTVAVFGGTGYTGGNIVREAAARGLNVLSVSRSPQTVPAPGVTTIAGNLAEVAQSMVDKTDVIVAALSPVAKTPASSLATTSARRAGGGRALSLILRRVQSCAGCRAG